MFCNNYIMLGEIFFPERSKKFLTSRYLKICQKMSRIKINYNSKKSPEKMGVNSKNDKSLSYLDFPAEHYSAGATSMWPQEVSFLS